MIIGMVNVIILMYIIKTWFVGRWSEDILNELAGVR
jgi:hypothetical protein